MERRRIPISLTLDPATIEEARGAAAEDGRSLSVWVDRALEAALRPRTHIMAGPFAGYYPDAGHYANKRILCGAAGGLANFADELEAAPADCPACLLAACRLWLRESYDR